MPFCSTCGVHHVARPGSECPSCLQRESIRKEWHDLAAQAARRRALKASIPPRRLERLEKRIRSEIRKALGSEWRSCPYVFALGLSCNCEFCRRYWPKLEEAARALSGSQA